MGNCIDCIKKNEIIISFGLGVTSGYFLTVYVRKQDNNLNYKSFRLLIDKYFNQDCFYLWYYDAYNLNTENELLLDTDDLKAALADFTKVLSDEDLKEVIKETKNIEEELKETKQIIPISHPDDETLSLEDKEINDHHQITDFDDEINDIMRTKTPESTIEESNRIQTRMSTPIQMNDIIDDSDEEIISNKQDLIDLIIKSIIKKNSISIQELSHQLDGLIKNYHEIIFYKDKYDSILFKEVAVTFKSVRNFWFPNVYYASQKVLTPIKI